MQTRYLLVLPLLLPLALWAQSSTDYGNDASSNSSAAASGAFGSQARDWVNLQISGRESVKKTPPMSGEVATHIYQRYLKSFDHPIPAHFARQNFVQGGSGGSGGGSQ